MLEPRTVDSPPGSTVAAASTPIDVQAAMLAAPRLADAAQALATKLAQAFAFDRFTVALLHGASLRVVGESGLANAGPAHEPEPALAAALFEAIDQQAAIAAPAAFAAPIPRIAQAHEALRAGGAAASVPLLLRGRPIGALCGWRRATAPVTAEALQSLQDHAALAAPLLALMHRNERSAFERLRDAATALLGKRGEGDPDDAPGALAARRRRRQFIAGGAVALAVLMLAPLPASVGGRARVEGAVQRVLVAPADGFLKAAHARPGERVRAGQPLVEFAQQDLLLDHARWSSQLDQYENSLAGANARRDRAQLVVHQARAAEAEAQLALVEQRLERSVLHAPFDGIVVRGDLSQQMGAPVQQGAELMTLAPADRFRLIVQIDERDIAQVQAGAGGAVTLGALPWQSLPLTVRRITPIATAVEGANVFEVEAELPRRPADLRPGLEGTANIDAGSRPLAWTLLRRAAIALKLTAWKWFG